MATESQQQQQLSNSNIGGGGKCTIPSTRLHTNTPPSCYRRRRRRHCVDSFAGCRNVQCTKSKTKATVYIGQLLYCALLHVSIFSLQDITIFFHSAKQRFIVVFTFATCVCVPCAFVHIFFSLQKSLHYYYRRGMTLEWRGKKANDISKTRNKQQKPLSLTRIDSDCLCVCLRSHSLGRLVLLLCLCFNFRIFQCRVPHRQITIVMKPLISLLLWFLIQFSLLRRRCRRRSSTLRLCVCV